jgi:hypothetical protein
MENPLWSFKTQDLVADQSLAANSTYASKFQKSKIYKGKISGRLFRRAAKNQPWHLGTTSFF